MDLFQKEPILVLLNGLAAVVNVVVVCLVGFDVVDWTGEQTAGLVAAVQAVANLIGAVLRSFVTPVVQIPPPVIPPEV